MTNTEALKKIFLIATPYRPEEHQSKCKLPIHYLSSRLTGNFMPDPANGSSDRSTIPSRPYHAYRIIKQMERKCEAIETPIPPPCHSNIFRVTPFVRVPVINYPIPINDAINPPIIRRSSRIIDFLVL